MASSLSTPTEPKVPTASPAPPAAAHKRSSSFSVLRSALGESLLGPAVFLVAALMLAPFFSSLTVAKSPPLIPQLFLSSLVISFLFDFVQPFVLGHQDSQQDEMASGEKIQVYLCAELAIILVHALEYAGLRALSGSSVLCSREFAGFFLGFSGLALRLWARWTLGEFFTFVVGIRKSHELITTGPYEYLLHPSYTGKFLHLAGFFLFTGFLTSWLVALVPMGYFMYRRVKNEEQVLEKHFGEIYKVRAKRVKRFIPGVF